MAFYLSGIPAMLPAVNRRATVSCLLLALLVLLSRDCPLSLDCLLGRGREDLSTTRTGESASRGQ